MLRIRTVLLAVAAALALAATGQAQPAPAQPSSPARPPPPTPKPGYVVPPENSAGLYPVSGEPIFKARCAGCHEPAIDRAPTRQELRRRAPRRRSMTP